MSEALRPATEWELQGIVGTCAEKRTPIEIVGGGSKRAIGRPVRAGVTVSTASLSGISLYEPTELVMSARTGTLLSQVEVELAGRGQMLAFEPVDLGPVLGSRGGAQTIGAVFSGNLSGSRRVSAGAARDHLLGVRGVNGRAEAFKSGGRVMKNVTGYDVSRAVAGSWGTLAVLTEVTFKVLPVPETAATLVYPGLPDDLAVEVMCGAMASPFEVSSAAHLPEALAARLPDEKLSQPGKPMTMLRIENFAKSVAYRTGALQKLLRVYGPPFQLDYAETQRLWSELRRLAVFPFGPTTLWRISTAPKTAPKLVGAIKRHMPAEAFYDWSGGLVWLEVQATSDAGAADIRRVVALHGGHATLIRAEENVRAAVEVFQPLAPGLERLTRGLKAAFDPLGLLNPGRMYAGV